jgi:hypothetical protein
MVCFFLFLLLLFLITFFFFTKTESDAEGQQQREYTATTNDDKWTTTEVSFFFPHSFLPCVLGYDNDSGPKQRVWHRLDLWYVFLFILRVFCILTKYLRFYLWLQGARRVCRNQTKHLVNNSQPKLPGRPLRYACLSSLSTI